MANLKQILQSNNTNIANAINEQNSQIKNYIDEKNAVLQNSINDINDEQTGIKQYFNGKTVAENFKTQLLSVREITADSYVTSGLPILNISAPSLTITAGAGDSYPGTGIDIQAQNISIQSASDEKPQVVSIKNLTDPTNDYDAAHKKYIDKQIEAVIGEAENPSTYNTIYGVKKYVDEQVAKIPDDVITEDKLAEKGYLVTIPDEYITEIELSEYISPDGDIVINTDWESIINKPNYINNLADEANEQTVLITNQNFSNNNIAKQSDLQDLSNGVDSRFANIATDYLKKEYIEQEYIKKSNGLEKSADKTWTIEDNAVYINPLYEIELSTSVIQLSASDSLSLSGANGINVNNDIILTNNSSIKDENGNILVPYAVSSLQSYQYYIPNIKFANDDSAQINAPLIWKDTIANTEGFIFASGQGHTLMLDFPIVFREDEFNTDNSFSKHAYKAHLIKLPEFFTAPHPQINMEYFVKIYRTSKNNETTITFISKPKLYKNTTYDTIEQDTYQNHLFLDLSSFKPESFPKTDSNNNKYSVEKVFMEIHCINESQTLIESN